MADFRETYLLSTWEMDLATDETTDEVLRVAALAYQLPRDGRVMRRLAPTAGNGATERLLRRIEFNQRCLAWGIGGGKGEEPKPELLDGERERIEETAKVEAAKMSSVAARLGIRTQGGD